MSMMRTAASARAWFSSAGVSRGAAACAPKEAPAVIAAAANMREMRFIREHHEESSPRLDSFIIRIYKKIHFNHFHIYKSPPFYPSFTVGNGGNARRAARRHRPCCADANRRHGAAAPCQEPAMSLTAIGINCTLKSSRASSSCDKLLDVVDSELRRLD